MTTYGLMRFQMGNRLILRRLALALVGAVLFGARTVPGFAQPAIPAGPAGEVLEVFLKAFNSGDRAVLETFVNSYDPADTAEGLLSFRTVTGGFTLLSIEQSAADALRFRVRGTATTLRLTAGSPRHHRAAKGEMAGLSPHPA